MSNNIVDQAKVYVALDGRDAETVMAELTAKTEKYTQALTDAYKAGDKINMKNALKDLKDTEKELANVQKQTFDVTKVMKDLNGANLKDLKRAQREISVELEHMTESQEGFNKKAEDLQKVTKRIDELKVSMKGTSEKGGGPFDRIKEIFTGVGLVELAKKGFENIKEGFKNMIESTKAGADKFEFAVAGMNNGIGYFWKTLSTGDWSNFITNMENAIKVGYKYAEMLDEVKEKTWGLSMKEAEMQNTNLKLEEDLRNKTLSNEDRMKAGQERIKNEEQLKEQRANIAQQELDANLLIAMDRSKLDKETLLNTLKFVDEETRAKAESYNKQLEDYKAYQKQVDNMAAQGVNVHQSDKYIGIKKTLDSATDAVKIYATALRGEGELTDKMIEGVVSSYNKVQQAQASSKENIKKVVKQVQTLQLEALKEALTEQLNAIETNAKQQETAEKEKFIKGINTQEQYNAQLEIINQNRLAGTAAVYQKNLQYFEFDKKEYSDMQKKIAEAHGQMLDFKVKQKEYINEVLKTGTTLIEAENKDYQARLVKAGIFEVERKNMTAEQLKVAEILEANHQDKLTKIANDAKKLNIEIAKAYADRLTQDSLANEQKILDARALVYQQDLKNAGDNAVARKAIEQKYNQDILTIEMGELMSRFVFLKTVGLSTVEVEKEIADKKTQILKSTTAADNEFIKQRDAVRKEYNTVSLIEQEQTELVALQAKHDLFKGKEEEYEQAILDIKLKYAQNYISSYQTLLSTLNSAVKGLEDAELANLQNKQDQETKALENEHDKRVAAAKGDKDKISKIDEEYNTKKIKLEDKQLKEQNAVKKKWAGTEFALTVATTVATTAMAAISAYASALKIPIIGLTLAPIAAAAAVVAGAAQIAIAKAQYDKVKALAKGKYNVQGADDGQYYNNVPYIGHADTGLYTKPTLISERGPEMVISAPHVRNLQMNYPAILNAIMATRVPQRADGNYPIANQQLPTNNQSNDHMLQIISANMAVMNRLNDRLDKGIYAKTVLDEFKTVEAQYYAQQQDTTKS